jgi:sensor c-di-GMP phosphodiesterase-like protein
MLASAMRRDELEVHYQPIVSLQSGTVEGVEALLRWPQHDGPWSRPEVFVRAAEELGIVGRLTSYLLERLRIDAPKILGRIPNGFVSVNLSSSDLHSRDIIGSLRRLLSETGLEPSQLVLEATEHSFVDPKMALEIVREIRSLGIRVGIDDFGTGFSSLSYLTNLPMDFLKIDRAFVETVGSDSATSEVALHIVQMASSLKMDIIAEGVETEDQAAFFRDRGVRYAQGWLFARAMPADQVVTFLDRGDSRPGG